MKQLPPKNSIVLAIILLVLGGLFTYFIFYQLTDLTRIKKVVSPDYTEIYIGGLGSPFQDISSLIKVPLSILEFNVYAENYLSSANTSEQIFLNVNFKGVYTHEIKPKEIGTYYSYFLKPTPLSFAFVYFVVGLPLTYAFLILTNSYMRLIVFGVPFRESEAQRS